MEKQQGQKLAYINGRLHFDGIDLEEVLKEHPSPLYLYSENVLRENYLSFQKAAEKFFDDFQICFALKANPNRELLKTLAAQGAGADIVSGGELERALESGIDASKIVFSGVGKTKAEIKKAILAGIYSFNIESFEELKDVNALAKEAGVQARAAFRLNPKVKALTHKYISTGFKTHKFGILEEDILGSIGNKEYWSHVKLAGLSVHIGSQLTDLTATKQAVKAVSACAKKLPERLDFIDVGGGLGVNYLHQEKDQAPSLEEYMQAVRENLDPGYPVKAVFEPGRRIAASAGIFVASVIRSKNSEDCRFLIVDGGMNDFARPSLYQAWHEIYPSRQGGENLETDIVGPICETADCFGEKRMLPLLGEGDFIAIADTGAYGHSMCSNYNLRKKPLEALINSKGSVQTA